MILICDDEKNIRRTLVMVLEGEGYSTQVAASAEEALVLLNDIVFDVVLMDVKLPGMDGIDALRHIKASDSSAEVIMISGHASLSDAVEATRLGAFDFLEKPIGRERVLITVRNALERSALKARVRDLSERDDPLGIVGDSAAMRSMYSEIEKVARTKARVLVTGESGSGKELVARAVHNLSPRRDGPFIKVNCAAIPADLIESELFGHEKGAFTGAAKSRRGQFELANKGTILLDEIGDMSASAQAKVLRVIQHGEITRVGGEMPARVDVRIVAATNKDLPAEIEAGRFREDLYFRLNVVPVKVPPLRERSDDIPLLLEAFLGHFVVEALHTRPLPSTVSRTRASHPRRCSFSCTIAGPGMCGSSRTWSRDW